jgi:hypothetical protein
MDGPAASSAVAAKMIRNIVELPSDTHKTS